MNKWIDMWIYDIVKPVHLYKYFAIVQVFFEECIHNKTHRYHSLPHCTFFISCTHTPYTKTAATCDVHYVHRWIESWSLLLSKCIPCFSGCANSGTSGSHQICDICVLLDVCPRYLKQSLSGIYIHLKVLCFILLVYHPRYSRCTLSHFNILF